MSLGIMRQSERVRPSAEHSSRSEKLTAHWRSTQGLIFSHLGPGGRGLHPVPSEWLDKHGSTMHCFSELQLCTSRHTIFGREQRWNHDWLPITDSTCGKIPAPYHWQITVRITWPDERMHLSKKYTINMAVRYLFTMTGRSVASFVQLDCWW
jgi:hypothetical protein